MHEYWITGWNLWASILSTDGFLDSSEDLVLVGVGVGGEVVVLHVLVADGGQEPTAAPPAPAAAPGLLAAGPRHPGAGLQPGHRRQHSPEPGPLPRLPAPAVPHHLVTRRHAAT